VSHRQMYMGIAGLLLAVIGLAPLLYPIYLGQYDAYMASKSAAARPCAPTSARLPRASITTSSPNATPHCWRAAPGRFPRLPSDGYSSPGFWWAGYMAANQRRKPRPPEPNLIS
jgi:hypothetical protein